MSGFFCYVSNMSESVPALDISDGLNSNYRNTTDYIIERQDLTCPKCYTIIQIVDSTTNGQIFYKKQKEKSISEERMGYFLWMIQNGRSRK